MSIFQVGAEGRAYAYAVALANAAVVFCVEDFGMVHAVVGFAVVVDLGGADCISHAEDVGALGGAERGVLVRA